MIRTTVLMLVVALTASACSDAGGQDSRVDTNLQFVLFGDTVETAGYQRLIETFTDANQDIDVTMSPVATQDDLLAKLTTGFAGGAPPDVFLINYRKYGQFAAQGALEPVQSYLDASDLIAEEDFAQTSMEAFRFDGDELTCMPQNVSSLQIYYNVDLFEQAGLEPPTAGWSWDDFVGVAAALTTGDRYGLGIEPSLIRIAPFVWSAGGDIVDDPADPTRLTLDEGPARDALNFFLDLRSRHEVVPDQREELSQDAESRFLNGDLGMYLNSRRVVPTLRQITDFTWDVAPLPVAPGGQPVTILHGDAYCMAAAGENKEATWRFIEFANSVEGQTLLAESGRTVPSRTDVARSDAFLETDQPPASSHVFVDEVDHVRAVPHTATWSRVEKEADNILEAIFYEQIDRDAGIQRLIDETAGLFGAP